MSSAARRARPGHPAGLRREALEEHGGRARPRDARPRRPPLPRHVGAAAGARDGRGARAATASASRVLPGAPAVQRLFELAGVTELVPFPDGADREARLTHRARGRGDPPARAAHGGRRVADGMAPLADVVPRLLDLVVPAVADVCVVHEDAGESRRGCSACASDGPLAPRVEAAAGRRVPARAPRRTRRASRHRGAGDQPTRCAARRPDRGDRAAARARAPDRERRARRRARGPPLRPRRPALPAGVRRAPRGRARRRARSAAIERQLEALVSGMDDAVTVRDARRPHRARERGRRRACSGPGRWTSCATRRCPSCGSRFALYRPEGRPLGDETCLVRALRGEHKPPSRCSCAG